MPNSPFPTLKWDGYCWRASWTAPWFSGASETDLIVAAACSEKTPTKSAPQPTSAQARAFQHLSGPAFQDALLTAFHKHIPELENSEWDAVTEFFELANVVILNAELDGIAYCALIFNSMEYESGVGVVAHLNRIVHLGNAEEAEEAAAETDLRRQKRLSSKSK